VANPTYTPNQINPPDVALEPVALRAGDSWTWKRIFEDYPTCDGWVLQYVLNSATARFAFPAGAIENDADGVSFAVAVASADTANVAPGIYELYAVLSNDGQQQTFQLQNVRIDANIARGTAPVDTRSFVKKTLDILELAIVGDQSPIVQEYEIHGRLVKYTDRIALKRLRDDFKAEYRLELIAKGEYTPRRSAGIQFGPTY
jgi:hypothetical protein